MNAIHSLDQTFLIVFGQTPTPGEISCSDLNDRRLLEDRLERCTRQRLKGHRTPHVSSSTTRHRRGKEIRKRQSDRMHYVNRGAPGKAMQKHGTVVAKAYSKRRTAIVVCRTACDPAASGTTDTT